MILKHLGLLDTFSGLILPSISSPFGVFLMRQAMRGVNNAYLESATIDGASLRRTFFVILFPMIRPTVSTLVLLNFMGSWNSYMWPLLVLSSNEKQTLQTVLGTMAGQYGGNEHIQMAGAVITILPILAVYCLSQRHVDQGMAIGGLK
jgi:multiple sugar transport system permease protein